MTLSKTIEKVIAECSVFSFISGLMIFFLAVNFFFAKFKQLNDGDDNISIFAFIVNISTLMCFAAMPFFTNNLLGLMGTQIVLRISDLLLIGVNNHWNIKEIKTNIMEKRWLIFDIVYLFVIVVFIVFAFRYDTYVLHISFLISYFIMAFFESVFDFYINRRKYGIMTAKKDDVSVTKREMLEK